MPAEYLFENLDDVPSVGYLEHKIGTMTGVEYQQCSYHTQEHWLKVWCGQELSTENQSLLAQYVDESVGKKEFQKASGHLFFEIQTDGQKRWQKHRLRVPFGKDFLATPQVSFRNTRFDGVADIEVIKVSANCFDFRVTSTRPKGKSQSCSLDFDWEAVSWVA